MKIDGETNACAVPAETNCNRNPYRSTVRNHVVHGHVKVHMLFYGCSLLGNTKFKALRNFKQGP